MAARISARWRIPTPMAISLVLKGPSRERDNRPDLIDEREPGILMCWNIQREQCLACASCFGASFVLVRGALTPHLCPISFRTQPSTRRQSPAAPLARMSMVLIQYRGQPSSLAGCEERSTRPLG